MKQVYTVTCINTTLPFDTCEWVFSKRIAAVGFVVKVLQRVDVQGTARG